MDVIKKQTHIPSGRERTRSAQRAERRSETDQWQSSQQLPAPALTPSIVDCIAILRVYCVLLGVVALAFIAAVWTALEGIGTADIEIKVHYLAELGGSQLQCIPDSPRWELLGD